MDNSVVFARLRQCALQWGYIGTTWQIWLNLSLLLLTRVQKTNGKSIGSATFAQLTAECRRAHLGVFFPLIIAPSHGGFGPNVCMLPWVPPKSITQMASHSVQLFLRRSWHSVGILYNGHIGATWQIRLNLCFFQPTSVHNPKSKSIGSALFAELTAQCHWACPGILSPNNCLFAWEIWVLLIHASLGSPESITQIASRSVQQFLHGSLVWQTDIQTTLLGR